MNTSEMEMMIDFHSNEFSRDESLVCHWCRGEAEGECGDADGNHLCIKCYESGEE